MADDREIDIHPATLRTVTRSLDLINDSLRRNPEANALFCKLAGLASRPGDSPPPASNEAGRARKNSFHCWNSGRVVALMQFNMYHHYTVDEHLLRALGNIASIERGDLKAEHPLATDIIKRIKSRDILYLTLLLHDVAKGLPGDHSKVGAVIAESVAARLGFSPEETSLICWLVLHHLYMSDTAQRRDVTDPKTVEDFVNVVQTPERLRLLLLLTVADIRAVGPGVWNAWKGQLLRELYMESEIQMLGGDTTPTTRLRASLTRSQSVGRIARPAGAKRGSCARLPAITIPIGWRSIPTHRNSTRAWWPGRMPRAKLWRWASARWHVFEFVTEIVVYTRRSSGAVLAPGRCHCRHRRLHRGRQDFHHH